MPAGRSSGMPAVDSEFHNQFGRLCDVLGMKALDLFQSPEHLAWVAERRQERDKAVAARAVRKSRCLGGPTPGCRAGHGRRQGRRKQAAIDKAAKRSPRRRRPRPPVEKEASRPGSCGGSSTAGGPLTLSFAGRSTGTSKPTWSAGPIGPTGFAGRCTESRSKSPRNSPTSTVQPNSLNRTGPAGNVAEQLFALYRTVGAGDSPPESLVLERCPWIVKKVLT